MLKSMNYIITMLVLYTFISISTVSVADYTVSVSDELLIEIPMLKYKKELYSATLKHNDSCWVLEKATKIEASATTAKLGHFGFDFSTNTSKPDWENQDLYITSWAAIKYPNGVESGDGLWVQSTSSSPIVPAIDKGEVSLDSVTEIPTDWSIPDDYTDYPLIYNHVYLIKARDGYAKFKVISPIGETEIKDMEVSVEYQYTSGDSF